MNRGLLRVPSLVALSLLVVATTGHCQTPSDQVALEAIKQRILAARTDHHGWCDSLLNIRFSEASVLRKGNPKSGTQFHPAYVPYRVRLQGTCAGVILMQQISRTFDGTGDFALMQNDFGEWSARALANPSVVTKDAPVRAGSATTAKSSAVQTEVKPSPRSMEPVIGASGAAWVIDGDENGSFFAGYLSEAMNVMDPGLQVTLFKEGCKLLTATSHARMRIASKNGYVAEGTQKDCAAEKGAFSRVDPRGFR